MLRTSRSRSGRWCGGIGNLPRARTSQTHAAAAAAGASLRRAASSSDLSVDASAADVVTSIRLRFGKKGASGREIENTIQYLSGREASI